MQQIACIVAETACGANRVRAVRHRMLAQSARSSRMGARMMKRCQLLSTACPAGLESTADPDVVRQKTPSDPRNIYALQALSIPWLLAALLLASGGRAALVADRAAMPI
jgi:hypothetical protein